jgi:hypothetical protein
MASQGRRPDMPTGSATLSEKVSSWRQSLPASEDFAPVDEPPNTVVTPANDQSGGEESSNGGAKLDSENDSNRAMGGEANGVDEDEKGEGDNTANIASAPAFKAKKRDDLGA